MTRPNVLDPASWCVAPVEFDGDPPEPVTAKVVYASPLRVDLGCGDNKAEGFWGIDRYPFAGVDQIADLSQGIPLSDDSVDELRAIEVLEHLPDKIRSLNEIWRVLKDGGLADVIVPSTDGRGAFSDPTHVSFWNRLSFFYVQERNPHRERFAAAYGIVARFAIEELGEMSNPELGIIYVKAKLRAKK